jgi:alkylated DNA repair dioxygenase AlkB
MKLQFQLFDGDGHQDSLKVLEGFRYRPALIGPADEAALLTRVRDLPFREFEFHGYTGKRRVVSFGWQYDYSGRQLRKADDIPEFLLPLRSLAASFAHLEPAALQQVLVTEYRPGTGIGWHRDKSVFGQVVGISLLAPCVLRFKRKVSGDLPPDRGRSRQWERVNVLAEPRSAYHLSGPARLVWEHSILRVDEMRYSITFRNVRED